MLVSGRVILVWGVDPTYSLQGVPTICNYGNAPYLLQFCLFRRLQRKYHRWNPFYLFESLDLRGNVILSVIIYSRFGANIIKHQMVGIFNMFIHSETTQNVFFVIPKWLAIWNVRRYLELGSDKRWQKIEAMNLIHSFILGQKNPAISRKTYSISSDTPLKIKILNLKQNHPKLR